MRLLYPFALVFTAGCGSHETARDGSYEDAAMAVDAGVAVDTGAADGTMSPGGDAANAPDGATKVIVGACDGLGAIGQFENITPPQADLTGNGITSVQLDPLHAGTVFVGTDSKGLLKSTDCGATWTKVNTGKNGAVLDSGSLWYVAVDPVDPDVIYAASLYGSDDALYKSTNGGVDWSSTMPAGGNVANTVAYTFFQEASIDPTNHLHLVASFHSDCSGAYPMCMAETHDGGTTWVLFKGPTPHWTEDARPIVLDDKTFLYVAVEGGAYYTADGGTTWLTLPMGGGSHIFRASNGTYYMSTLYGTYRSPDAKTWTQIPSSPNACGITGDGEHIFIGNRQQSAYWSSAESDGNTWATYTAPSMSAGSVLLAYDTSHHVMYSANTSAGLYRVVTR